MMRELAKDPTFTIYYTSKKELMGEHRKILDAYGLNRVQLIPPRLEKIPEDFGNEPIPCK